MNQTEKVAAIRARYERALEDAGYYPPLDDMRELLELAESGEPVYLPIHHGPGEPVGVMKRRVRPPYDLVPMWFDYPAPPEGSKLYLAPPAVRESEALLLLDEAQCMDAVRQEMGDEWLASVLSLLEEATVREAWLPTPENINALPEPIRKYIHDIETRADPAGEVRELVIAKDTIQALERLGPSPHRALAIGFVPDNPKSAAKALGMDEWPTDEYILSEGGEKE